MTEIKQIIRNCFLDLKQLIEDGFFRLERLIRKDIADRNSSQTSDERVKQIVNDTVTTTVLQLKAAGLLGSDSKTAFEKTEALLYQYPKLKDLDEPYARRVVQEIDACLAEVQNEPYVGVIRLYYFDGLTNVACSMELRCDERTCRRYRRKLVERFSVRLASDAFIRELLL